MIDQGYRLACQARLQDDMRICIVNPEPSVSWKPIRDDEYIPVSYSHQKAAHSGKPLGVAVDLGTTHICLTLWDMAAGKRLAGVSGRNPQARFGVDVLTWLVAACESQERSQEMGQIVREAIAEAIRETVSQTACKTHDIRHVAIVGNTGMLALLTGKNHTALLQPELWMQETDILPEDTRPWCLSWGIDPAASIHVIPPLGGFVGSDISAGIMATHLADGKAPDGSLLIDFGTNSEIALWDGKNLWITSAAGGSAFEGCGITWGNFPN